MASEVDTLKSEKGKFWTEGGKCGMKAEKDQRTRSAPPDALSSSRLPVRRDQILLSREMVIVA